MKIFISYRRDDSAGYAGRLFDHLTVRFGARNVFMDIDTIEPGEDFRNVIRNAVGTCDVVLVLIGKQWLKIADAQGRRRLDDPQDWVRAEIAGALANPHVRVIPVLVRGATMPDIHELPDDVKELSWRNAIELSDRRFQYDANKLIGVIERAGGKPAKTSLGKIQNIGKAKYWGIILGLSALGFVIWMLGSGIFPLTVFKTSTPIVAPQSSMTSNAEASMVSANEMLLKRTIAGSSVPADAALTSDGQWLALAPGYDGAIKIYSTSEDRLISSLNAGTTVLSLAFSPDKQLLAAGLSSTTVKVWRLSDGVELQTFEGLSSGVYNVMFSPDSQTVAAAAAPDIMLWRISDGKMLQQFGGISVRVYSLAFSPDGTMLASGLDPYNVRLWQVSDGASVRDLQGASADAVAFSPNGEILATQGQGSSVDLWRVRDGELVLPVLTGHTTIVESLAFSPDSQTLVTASSDIEVRRWQISDHKRQYTLKKDGTNLYSIIFSADGQTLVAVYRDGTVQIWQVP